MRHRLKLVPLILAAVAMPATAQTRANIEQTMKRATEFMVDKVSTRGGYVWSYLPDLSRRWGEVEAWPTELKVTSHVYRGPSPAAVAPGDYGSTRVGDETDTSPYIDPHAVIGISTGTYIENMERLIAALQTAK